MINLTTEFYPDRRYTETLEGGATTLWHVQEIEDFKSDRVMKTLVSVETHLVFRSKLSREVLWQCWCDIRRAEFQLLREWSNGQNND